MKLPIRGPGLLVVVLLLAAGAGARAAGAEPTPERKFQSIDLQPKANQNLDNDFHTHAGNNLKPLPRGRQKLKGVEFVIGDKFLQLAGKLAPDYPEKVEAIPVNQKLTRMHFLHATGWGSPNAVEGTQIGSFEMHYDIMPDLVHLSPKGYEIWGHAIELKVAELLEGKFPFPELPKRAGRIDKDAPQTFTETESGLKYRILRKGAGAAPNVDDTVTVEYKGWLDGGKAFDSSYDGGPASFPLNAVIKGWTEGLQLVGTGGMIELEIPFDLAYGAAGRPPQIPPEATLHFLVELLEVN